MSPGMSTQAVSNTLVCFKQSLKAATTGVAAEHEAAHAPGVHLRQADHAICLQAAQVCLCLPACNSTVVCTKCLGVMSISQAALQASVTSYQASMPHVLPTYNRKLFNAARHAHECRLGSATGDDLVLGVLLADTSKPTVPLAAQAACFPANALCWCLWCSSKAPKTLAGPITPGDCKLTCSTARSLQRKLFASTAFVTLWSMMHQSPQNVVQSSSAAQGSSPEEHSADLALSQGVLDTVRYFNCFECLLAITLRCGRSVSSLAI